MTNSETRMTNQSRMTNDESVCSRGFSRGVCRNDNASRLKPRRQAIGHLVFVIHSSFWFRHSGFTREVTP
jgi:hypothetical protein